MSTEGEATLTTCNSNLANICYNGPNSAPGGYASEGYPYTGPSVNDYICWPTEFDATTSNAKPNFFVSQQNGNWYASGSGYMACMPKCCFKSNGGSSDVAWLSGSFSASASSSGNNLGTTSTAMWWGDSMPFISGLWHINNGMTASDWAETEYTSAWDPINLTARSYHSSNVVTTGYSFFVGIPSSGHVVKMSPPWGQLGYQAWSGHLAQMIPIKDGVCTYTHLGQQDGSTYRAEMYSSGGDWWLSSTSTYQGTVEARCYYYNQNQ